MISVRGICKAFERTIVLNQFSLEVAGAERVALMGPSGCGKTTLLRLIAGLEMPEQGEVWIGGRLVSRPGWILAPHLRGIGMVFQSPALFPHLNVADNICFGCSGLPVPERKVRLEALLAQLSLGGLARRYPHQLSGGEARRVALARALAPYPAVLLLDEAFTNLNRELKQCILAVLLDYLDTHRPTLVLVTHDSTEASQLGAISLRVMEREAQ